MANIKDIAKACGVAVSTVSYALNDNELISLETRRKIQKVAKEMGYYPNSYARSLKCSKTHKIGIFITDFAGTIHPAILNGIDKILSKSEYQMVVTLADDKMTMIKDKSVDLAVLIDSRISQNQIEDLKKYCPLIVYDKKYNNLDSYYVMLENEDAVYNETKYLLGLGAKKIAFLFGPHSSLHNQERFMGYMRALEEVNLDSNALVYDANSFTEDAGYEVMSRVLDDISLLPFDAILASNDELAFGALKALNEHNYCVPNDCILAGFDNNEKSKFVNPPLTTVNVDWIQCGKDIARFALSILSGDEELDKVKKIKTNLIVRESTNIIKKA